VAGDNVPSVSASAHHKGTVEASSKTRSTGVMLTTTATWDLIQSHPLVKQGLVDITDVCERLRGLARCSGQGPVYEEGEVWRMVENSRRGGGDELI
jgi:AP-1-like transcription factor